MFRSSSCLPAVLLMNCLLAYGAHAQSSGTDTSTHSDTWQVEAGAYLFGAGISGDAGVRQFESKVDVTFGDILENLEGGAMAYGKVTHGPWKLIGDVSYLSIADDSSVVTPGGVVGANFETELGQIVASAYAGHTIYEMTKNVNSSVPVFSVDGYVGARYNRVNIQFDAQATAFGLVTSASRDRTVEWVDPVIAVNVNYVPIENWNVSLWGDFGGFGVGSERTWQAYALAGYTFDSGMRLFGGYRVLYFDYEEGSGSDYLSLDLTYSGPVLGLGYRF